MITSDNALIPPPVQLGSAAMAPAKQYITIGTDDLEAALLDVARTKFAEGYEAGVFEGKRQEQERFRSLPSPQVKAMGCSKKREWIKAKTAIILKDGIHNKPVTEGRAKATAKKLWEKKRGRKGMPGAKAINVVWLQTGGISVAVDKLQYKNTDGAEDGLNEQRRQEDMDKPFDPLVVPPIALWRTLDGLHIYVVDGHKRLDHAKRKGIPVIRAFFIEAENFEEAKKKGEQLNEKMGTKAIEEDSELFIKAKDALGHGSWKKDEREAHHQQTTHSQQSHAVTEKIVGAIKGSEHLTEEKKTYYEHSIRKVLGRMPLRALDSIHKHQNEPPVFYPNTKQLGVSLLTKTLKTRRLDPDTAKKYERLLDAVKNGQTSLGGAVDWNDEGTGGYLHLDGDPTFEKSGKYGGSQKAEGTYAHELTHMIDGPNHRISSHQRWIEAYNAEIGPGAKGENGEARLTKYAHTNTAEGLAEFGRLVYGSDLPLERIEAEFPKATQCFKDAGLWPEEK